MSSPLMHPLQLGLSDNKFGRTGQSSSSVDSLRVEQLPSSFSEWAFDDAHSHSSLDEQMCRLIDNLAVSPHLPGQFCQLDTSIPKSSHQHLAESSSTQSLPDGAHRDRTDSSDSGVISDSADFQIPDKVQVDAILTRLEAYFSDDHLRTDTFLLKHIRRSKEGFVSLKLVSSFQKMKSLTKDWRVVAYCIRNHSKLLELNDTNTKVRRLASLPDDILQLPITKKKQQSRGNSFSQNEHSAESGFQDNEHLFSDSSSYRSSRINSPNRASFAQFVEDLERRWPRIVFAFEPAGSLQTASTLQNALRTYCERFGQLVSIKLLRPEKAVRLDLIRWLLLSRSLDPRRWRQLSALVEFANVEQVQKALESQSPMSGWPGEIQLCSLSMRPMASGSVQTNGYNSTMQLSSGLSSTASNLGSSMFVQPKHDAFATGRSRNRSDLGALEQLRLDHHYLHSQHHYHMGSSSSISESATTLSMSGSNGNIASSSGLADMFGGRSPPLLDLNSVRPRASTISHFAGSAFARRQQLHNPDQRVDSSPSIGLNHKTNESCWPNNNGSNSLIGPIARPKSNSFTVHPQSSAVSRIAGTETGNVLGTGNLSSSNLLRLPKGPVVGGIGFDGFSRSRSTSSPSGMMKLFGLP